MYNHQLPRFGYNPKHLTAKHIKTPELALVEFFDDDNLKSHLTRLKEWRDCVIGEYYWKGQKNSPAEIFYFYELNVRLVEALYMFKLSENRGDGFINGKLSTDNYLEIIEKEKSEWPDYPTDLSDEELKDPYKPLKSLFIKFNVDEYCTMLSEWLGFGLSGHAANEFVTANELFGLYENLQKMYSIAYLLFKRQANNPSSEIEVNQEYFFINNLKPSREIKGIESNPTASEKLILEEIKNHLHKRVPQIQLINHIGTHLSSLTFFILFLVDDDMPNSDSSLRNKIEDQCRFIANIQAFVHKVGTAKTALEEQRRFWVNAFLKGTIIYKNPMLHIPMYNEPIKANEDEAIKCWNRWGDLGKSFFEGAKFYREAGDTHISLYFTQQSLSYSLTAFIMGTIGYKFSTNNVPRLLRVSTLVTDTFADAVGEHTSTGKAILDLLHGSYVFTKYEKYSNIDPVLAETTFYTAEKLLLTIEYLYKKYVSNL